MTAQNQILQKKAKYSRRSFLRFSALAMGGLVTMSCAPAAASTGGGTIVPPTEPVTLSLLSLSSDSAPWQIGLDMFELIYPNIKIEPMYIPPDELLAKVEADFATGTSSDVVTIDDNTALYLASKEILLSLDDLMYRDSTADLGDFNKYSVSGFNVMGEWFGLPFNQRTWVIYYNKELFDNVGVAYPPGSEGEPWNWSDFLKASQEITESLNNSEKWGVLINNNPSLSAAFIYSIGGQIFDEGGWECLINSPEATEGLQFLVNMIHKEKVAPSTSKVDPDIDLFASGQVAMCVCGSWELLAKSKKLPFDFDIGYLPIGKELRTFIGAGLGIGVVSDTRRPEQSWAFLRSYTSKETLIEMIGKTGYDIPARRSAIPAYLEQVDVQRHEQAVANQFTIKQKQAIVEQFEWGQNDLVTLASQEFNRLFAENLGPIYHEGNGSISNACAIIQAETNKALESRWEEWASTFIRGGGIIKELEHNPVGGKDRHGLMRAAGRIGEPESNWAGLCCRKCGKKLCCKACNRPPRPEPKWPGSS